MKNNKNILGLDNFDDDKISEDQITEVLEELVAKGLATSYVKDGETYYQLTEDSEAVGRHLDTDPKLMN